MNIEKKKKITPKEALIKAASYCAYQERCHEEVKEKLSEWNIYGNDAGEIMHQLVEQNYLNEERFSKAFAGGKFRTKKWGKKKIILELKLRKVSEYCINEGLKEINDADYISTLKEIAGKKLSSIKEKNMLIKRNKVAQYLIGKGFESETVWDILRKIE